MTTAITQGSTAIAAVLESIASDLVGELQALRQLFEAEVAPRAKRIGQLLTRARGQFPSNAGFYDWAEVTVGIRQRQVRSYIRFFERFELIASTADEQGVPISSIEQGLALLAPASVELERTDQEVRLAAVAQATGRAKGALSRALEAIYEISPGGLTRRELEILQAATDLLTRWGEAPITTATVEITPIDHGPALSPEPEPELAVDDWSEAPEAQPLTITATLPTTAAGLPSPRSGPDLPYSEPPGKWSLAQLEEGRAHYGSWSKLAEVMSPNPRSDKPWTKAALSGAFQKLLKESGLDAED